MAAEEEQGFELIPADDFVFDERADVAAAAASALEAPEAPAPDADDPPEPTGYSWAFDFVARRFIRYGSAPAVVHGNATLEQRCLLALNAARYAHRVFSPAFGLEGPIQGIGLAGDAAREAADDWRVKVRDALLIFDDVTDVQLSAAYDPVAGTIQLSDFVVTTNEDVELSFPDIRIDLTPGG